MCCSVPGELYLSVGVSYVQLRCFLEAVQCFQQALGPTAEQPPLLAKVLHNLGAAQNSVGEFAAAVPNHKLAAGLYGQSPSIRSISCYQSDRSHVDQGLCDGKHQSGELGAVPLLSVLHCFKKGTNLLICFFVNEGRNLKICFPA